jgi:septum formation protein
VRILLASASPRRRALLASAGIEVEVQPVDIDELRVDGEAADRMAARLAREKAWAIEDDRELAVLAADTVVALSGVPLGKPEDEREASAMLRRLSGEEHEVVTGYCARFEGQERTGLVRTTVWFRSLTDDEIERYVATGEPLDKAGSYGIQGEGGALVDRVSGSYTNVVGLPLAEVLWDLEGLVGPR